MLQKDLFAHALQFEALYVLVRDKEEAAAFARRFEELALGPHSFPAEELGTDE
jgi:hypothetical protein